MRERRGPHVRLGARVLAPLALFLTLAACGGEEYGLDELAVPGPDWTEPPRPTPGPFPQLPRLRVSGPDLVTALDGTAVRLRGVNVCSLEFDASGRSWDPPRPSGTRRSRAGATGRTCSAT